MNLEMKYVLSALALLLCLASPTQAGWYDDQYMTPAAIKRLNPSWDGSCCKNADVYRTRFRIKQDGSRYGSDQWQYYKDGAWHDIPPDIVQHKPTPNRAPVLFISNEVPLCFIIDKPGG